MSRTTRYIDPYWYPRRFSCYGLNLVLAESCHPGNYNPVDPRDERAHGWDQKSRSLLYEGAIKVSSWSRDYVSSPAARKHYKKVARRYRRRETIDLEDYYDN